jgi:hypothetical protein
MRRAGIGRPPPVTRRALTRLGSSREALMQTLHALGSRRVRNCARRSFLALIVVWPA